MAGARGGAPALPLVARALRAKRRAEARHGSASPAPANPPAAEIPALPPPAEETVVPPAGAPEAEAPSAPAPALPDLATLARSLFGPLNGVELDLFGRRGELPARGARAW